MNSVKTVLLVEEEFLIALDVQRMIEGRAEAQIMLARTASEALSMQSSWGQLHLAIVELRPADAQALELCMVLTERAVPVIASIGEGRSRQGLPGLPNLPVLARPIAEEELASAIETALANTQNE